MDCSFWFKREGHRYTGQDERLSLRFKSVVVGIVLVTVEMSMTEVKLEPLHKPKFKSHVVDTI